MSSAAASAISPAAARLAFLDSFRGVAIAMVVAIHAIGYAPTLPHDWHVVLRERLLVIAVPAFFLCDGFLFRSRYGGGGRFDYGTYVRRSAWRLLVPWVAFSAIYLALRIPAEQGNIVTDRLVLGQPAAVIVRNIWASLIAPQLYFLVSLFLLRCASPVFYALAQRPRIVLVATWLGYLAALYTAAQAGLDDWLDVPGGQEPLLHAITGAQYYLLGMIAAAYRDEILRAAGPLVAVTTAVAAVSSFHHEPLVLRVFQNTYLVALFVSFWNADASRNVAAGRWLTDLGRQSMGIFVLHAPVLLKGLSVVVQRVATEPRAVFAILFVTALVTSWLASRYLSRQRWGQMLLGQGAG